ncbi:UNVERIFIED_CONTAM: hypothetical protein GTU68_027586 [Idotea baltica]|nr:hypothetical protein [Idotea baltica]
MYTGNCRAAMPRWYYDASQGRCVGFTYGGCNGNANRFSSVEHCERQCGKYTNRAICELPRDFGPCSDGYKRWYFSTVTGSCEGFVYGGCGGNQNRFKNFKTCVEFCQEAIQKYKLPGN